MNRSVIDNIFSPNKLPERRFIYLSVIFCLFIQSLAEAQVLTNNFTGKTTIPKFSELLERRVDLRPELKNVHPRLFFTAEDLPKMRERARGADREIWLAVLKEVASFQDRVPDIYDEDLYKSGLAERKKDSMTQYSLAFRISQVSFVYIIEGDEKYLKLAKKLTSAACEMPLWGYKTNKPNVDLPPAHLLYAVAFAYDVLFDKFSNEEKETIRNKLIKQARLMYEYFKYKPDKKYTYSQNHTWIPLAGLAIASYALLDETEEAKNWSRLSRAVFDRTMLTFGTDGYFYEGFHYFGFAFRWMIRYFDTHRQVTGENLYLPMKPKFAQMKYFAMHSILPDRENVFDFADVGDGALNRNKISKREKLFGEYDILYRLAGIYQDSQAQTIADFIRTETTLETREPMWAFINHDSALKPAPLSQIPTQLYFNDHDTVFWRTDWSREATAFAFRCAPPEGHHAAGLAKLIPDWRQNTGHAHPDANSFIIYAKGKYLTGDTGYLGIKQTDDHNTILVNKRGQAKDGVYEMFKEVSNEKLNDIRIAEIWGTDTYFYVRGEAAGAFYEDLRVRKFDRNFLYAAPDYFVVWDELETETPADFTFLLNADREILLNGSEADLLNENTGLRVVRISPFEAISQIVPQMIQARGLPGRVDQGNTEQRGVQLQTVSVNQQSKFEFLHFLQPYTGTEKNSRPKVSALENGVKGLRINWPNGETEHVFLNGRSGQLNSDAGRLIIRNSRDNRWSRLIFQNAKTIAFENHRLFESSKAVSAALQISKTGNLSGWMMSKENTQIKLVIPIRPQAVKLNGKAALFNYTEAAGLLILNLKAGRNFIETS